jgi:hypothetical protein
MRMKENPRSRVSVLPRRRFELQGWTYVALEARMVPLEAPRYYSDVKNLLSIYCHYTQ